VTTRRPLRDLYLELNERFWGGRLPRPLRVNEWLDIAIVDLPRFVTVRRVAIREGMRGPGPHHATGRFIHSRTAWPARIVVLSWRLIGTEQERRTLIHEMVHAELWFAGVREKDHGPRFVAALESLAAYGEEWVLEAVERYRVGKEDAR
jgi:hypothetical protein